MLIRPPAPQGGEEDLVKIYFVIVFDCYFIFVLVPIAIGIDFVFVFICGTSKILI